MMHGAADLLGVALLATGALAWLLGRLPPLGHGRDSDWGDAVAGAGAAIAGAWAAITFAGPGALPWMWLGLFCWWGLRSWGRPHDAPETRVPPGPVHAVASVLALAAAGSVLLRGIETAADTKVVGMLALVLGLAVAVAIPVRVARGPFGIVPGLCLAGLAIASLATGELGMIEATRQTFEAALNWEAGAMGAAGAMTAVVVHMGLVAAGPGAVASPSGSGAGLRRFLLVSIISFDVGMAMSFSGGGADARLDDASMQAADGRAHMRPLERAHVRAFLPSPRGQSIVLPADTPLQPDHRYTVHFRANPRGYQVGMVSETRNVIAVPAFASTQGIEAVFFRSKDDALSRSASFDRRINVVAKQIKLPSGAPLIELEPVDPEVDFKELAEQHDGPYIPLQDVQAQVAVFKASAAAEAVGDHLAMVEVNGQGPRENFDLETIVKMGFRGPFLQARPPAPLAFLASDASSQGLELGAQKLGELRAPPRGLQLGEIRPNGELALPPWAPLADLKYVAFHPAMKSTKPAAAAAAAAAEGPADPNAPSPGAAIVDPAQALEPVDPKATTFYVPVAPAGEGGSAKLHEGQLRLKSAEGAPTDLRAASKLAAYEGPFLMVPPQPLWLELHSGQNLADPANTPLAQRGLVAHRNVGARVWVPLGAGAEPVAAAELITPHAGAWIEAGMVGPFAQQDSAGALANLGWFGLAAAWLAWALALTALWPAHASFRVMGGAAAIVAATSVPAIWLLIAAGASGIVASLLGALAKRSG